MSGYFCRGYDFYITKPNKKEEIHCRVCGAKCDVERGVKGPTNVASAIGGLKFEHDFFSCPNYDKEWHYRACKLVEELEDTLSKSVRELIKQDLDELLEENMNTESKSVSE